MGSGRSLRLVLACLALAGTASAQLTDGEVETRMSEGGRQYGFGDLAGARAIFEAVLAERPDHVIANYQLALMMMQQGEIEPALAVLNSAFARNLSVTPQFYVLAASLHENLGRVDEAVRTFERGIAAYPDHYNLRTSFGITQIRSNDAAGAKLNFERAITLDPNDPTAHFYVGQIYAAEGLTAAAILALGKGIGVDTVAQRRVAAANIIKNLMDNSIGLGEEGVPIVVMPVDYMLAPMTIPKFTSAVGMHYAMGFATQKKTGGDLSYEPYAMAFALLVTEFAGADIDPASHFAAGYYQEYFSELFEAGHQLAYAHLILATLNPEVSAAWAQANRERMDAYRAWRQSR